MGEFFNSLIYSLLVKFRGPLEPRCKKLSSPLVATPLAGYKDIEKPYTSQLTEVYGGQAIKTEWNLNITLLLTNINEGKNTPALVVSSYAVLQVDTPINK